MRMSLLRISLLLGIISIISAFSHNSSVIRRRSLPHRRSPQTPTSKALLDRVEKLRKGSKAASQTPLIPRDVALLHPRRVDYSGCQSPEKLAIIEEEAYFAAAFLLAGYSLPPEAYTFLLFFPPEEAELIRFLFLEKAFLLHPAPGVPPLHIRCDEPSICKENTDAFTNSEDRSITFCDSWFETRNFDTKGKRCAEREEKFLDEYYTRGMTIVHELMHVKGPETWQIEDLAYEAQDSIALAGGLLDGLDEVDSMRNADSYAYVAMGAYFSRLCGHDIDPFPMD